MNLKNCIFILDYIINDRYVHEEFIIKNIPLYYDDDELNVLVLQYKDFNISLEQYKDDYTIFKFNDILIELFDYKLIDNNSMNIVKNKTYLPIVDFNELKNIIYKNSESIE